MILDFYTIKIIDNHVAKDQILEKQHKDYSSPFIQLLSLTVFI